MSVHDETTYAYHQQCYLFAHAADSAMQQAWEQAQQAEARMTDDLMTAIQAALTLALRYGQIDGDHHKAWVIDQMCRALLQTPAAYVAFVANAKDGEDGPDSYDWNEGIPP